MLSVTLSVFADLNYTISCNLVVSRIITYLKKKNYYFSRYREVENDKR